jgi:hypothetical protein
MAELDETVASIIGGDINTATHDARGDNGSMSSSISTDVGHVVSTTGTNRFVTTTASPLIGNMEKVRNDCINEAKNNNHHRINMIHRRTQSPTSTSNRQRSKTSKKKQKTKKRGSSLERLIRRTITMTSYMAGLDKGGVGRAQSSSGSSSSDHSHSQSCSSTSTEDILRDLSRADAVLTLDSAGVFSSPIDDEDDDDVCFLSPFPIHRPDDHYCEPNLLPPPIVSSVKVAREDNTPSGWDWNPRWEQDNPVVDATASVANDHDNDHCGGGGRLRRLSTIASQTTTETDATTLPACLHEEEEEDPFGSWPAFDDTGGPFSAAAASPFYEADAASAHDEQGFPSSSVWSVSSPNHGTTTIDLFDPTIFTDFSSFPNPFADASSSASSSSCGPSDRTDNTTKHGRFVDNPSPSCVAQVDHWF